MPSLSEMIDVAITRELGMRAGQAATGRVHASAPASAPGIEGEIDDAVVDGRIAEQDRIAWRSHLTEAPETSRRILASMPIGRRWTDEEAADELAYKALFETAPVTVAASAADQDDEALYESWFGHAPVAVKAASINPQADAAIQEWLVSGSNLH